MLESRRETWAFVISGAILLLLALLVPAPVKEIDGEREIVVNGGIVPKWLATVVIGAVFLIVFAVVYKLLGRLPPPKAKPPQEEHQTMKVSEVYARKGGGFVAWQPEEPGGLSP